MTIPSTMTAEDNVLSNQYRSMNEREIEVWRCFLLERDGYFCLRCQKSINRLIEEDKKRRIVGQIEERKTPLLTIDHINGDSRITSIDGVMGSNLQLLCYSCNLKKRATQSEYHKLQSHDVAASITINRDKMPKYIDWLKEQCIKFKNVCHAEALSAGCKAVGVKSQITAERYIELECGTENGLFDVDDMTCDSRICKGKHIFFKGERPLPMTDKQFIQMEMQDKKLLSIKEKQDPRNPVNKELDRTILADNLPIPLSTETDVYSKMKLSSHVTKVYTNLREETKKYR